MAEEIAFSPRRQDTGRIAMHYRAQAIAMTLAALAMTIAAAQAFDETKYPDWSGQWFRVPDNGPPRYDPTKPLRKQEAPLKPEYQAIYEASLKDIDNGGFGLDLHYSCLPQGMPRQMAAASRFEVLISPAVTHIIFEEASAPRRIYTDGREWPKANEEPSFLGYSLGKWLDTDGDGRYDTLEIETRNMRAPRTWDQTGIPMADDNDGVIRERIYLDKEKPGILHDEITTIDNSLTRPWTVLKSYRREKTVTWVENNCVEGNTYITIAGQVYFRSSDGRLMPSRKGQPPPDLHFFKSAK
jgi:hypothetical protein